MGIIAIPTYILIKGIKYVLTMVGIEEIIIRHINGEANEADEAIFQTWLQESVKHQQLFQEIATPHLLQRELQLMQQFDEVQAWKKLQQGNRYSTSTHRIRFLKTTWFRYAAAIILIVGGAITAIVVSSDRKSTNPAATLSQKGATSDIPPGGDKAVLTLADGSKIILDNAANGNLATQGNAAIVKLANGQIAYNLKGSADGEVVMNTMTTPKGGQYQLTLPDGSKVWLNAASFIQFPTAFLGSERKVKIAGEVYFEVAKNKEQPFIVDIEGKANVLVLGTSFNINSYSNEESIRTTLIDGSVKIIKGSNEAILKPGYQAVLDQENDGKNAMIQVQTANIDQTIAWKNGLFNLEELDTRAFLRQLERWYDIKVEYKGTVDNIIFQGEFLRSTKLSDVVQFLKNVGVKCRLEGKTLIVL